jgi:hypothetical protein
MLLSVETATVSDMECGTILCDFHLQTYISQGTPHRRRSIVEPKAPDLHVADDLNAGLVRAFRNYF